MVYKACLLIVIEVACSNYQYDEYDEQMVSEDVVCKRDPMHRTCYFTAYI